MKLKLATVAFGALMAAGPAMADLVVPNLSYRTGPYGANGTQYADGFNDYFTLLNERDGGIGGEKVQTPECETAYNTEKASNAMRRPRERARWSITPCPPASPIS